MAQKDAEMSGRAVLALVVALVLASGPVRADDGDSLVAKQFLDIGRAALRAKDPGQAASALRRAVERDAELLEARFLLGKAYQVSRRSHDAAEQFREFLKLAEARKDLPADAAAWKTDATNRLRTLCVHLHQWDGLRIGATRTFSAFAAEDSRMPSAVRALEITLAIDPEDPRCGKRLRSARARVPKPLPAEPDSPDPDGAKLLIEQAVELRRLGRNRTALKLTRSAAGLSRDARTLLALAEAYRTAADPASAAVVAAAASDAVANAPAKDRAALALAAANLVRQADPAAPKVAAALAKFATDAEKLAQAAIAGGDVDTAGAIVKIVLTLLPERGSALALKQKLMNVPLTCTRVPDLSGNCVGFTATPAGGKVKRTARTIELKSRTVRMPGGYAGVDGRLTLKPVKWGKFVRMTFRVRHTGDRAKGFLRLDLWPAGWGAQLRSRYGRKSLELQLGDEQADYRVLEKAEPALLTKLFRSDDTYEVTFEKKDAVVSIFVADELVAKIELTKELQRKASRENVEIGFGGAGPRGRDVMLQLTMLDFACSPDCLRPQ